MHKVILAALLTATAMPAQAFLVMEFRGTALVYQPGVYGGQYEFSAKGYCYGPCNGGANPYGMGFSYSEYHAGSLGLSIVFDDGPLPNYLDGIFHTGSGGGSYVAENYLGYIFAEMNITSGRAYDDGVPFPSIEPYQPQILFGAKLPETATWAMMIGGLGLVGASMRWRSARISFV